MRNVECGVRSEEENLNAECGVRSAECNKRLTQYDKARGSV